MRHNDSELYERLETRFHAVLPTAKPREEAMMMYALALRGRFPGWLYDSRVLLGWAEVLGRRHCSVSELMNRLMALAMFAGRGCLGREELARVVHVARAM